MRKKIQPEVKVKLLTLGKKVREKEKPTPIICSLGMP